MARSRLHASKRIGIDYPHGLGVAVEWLSIWSDQDQYIAIKPPYCSGRPPKMTTKMHKHHAKLIGAALELNVRSDQNNQGTKLTETKPDEENLLDHYGG